jgi:hypothetical protein
MVARLRKSWTNALAGGETIRKKNVISDVCVKNAGFRRVVSCNIGG